MNNCDYCQHCEMCRWREELEERGCDFFDDCNKWIPVSERLPEEDCESYLVCCADGYIESIMYDRSMGWFLNDDIVAWMPLPKPYEPQESEVTDADSN